MVCLLLAFMACSTSPLPKKCQQYLAGGGEIELGSSSERAVFFR